MVTIISHSPEETQALGERWGREATAGQVIGLTGDLGAGKTQLVKGIARGLQIPARIQSPTFALVNEHSGGRLPLYHLDLYRLENRAQIGSAGLEEYFYQMRGVTVIEWIERWIDSPSGERAGDIALPERFRLVRIESPSIDIRQIFYDDSGA